MEDLSVQQSDLIDTNKLSSALWNDDKLIHPECETIVFFLNARANILFFTLIQVNFKNPKTKTALREYCVM